MKNKQASPSIQNRGSWSITGKQQVLGWVFTAPAFIGFLLFTLGPMIVSLILSFTDYRPAAEKITFIGIQNYKNLFTGADPLFYKSLRVTFTYVLMSVPLSIIVMFMLAMLLNQDFKGKTFFRSMFYLPSIVPTVATAMIWTWLMDPDLGLLNELLRMLNLPTSMWIYGEKTVIPSLAVMNLWTAGGTMVIFLAGLQGVPRTLYEAIDIDGGNMWHRFAYITIPMMSPTIFYNLIMGLINGFQVFTQAFIMTEGGPNNGSLFYVYYLYRKAFQHQEMGAASAVAWVLFVIIMIITLFVFKTAKSWVYYEGEG